MAIETINGFNDTDKLNLTNLPYRRTASATYNSRTEILTVESGRNAEKVRLTDTSVRQYRAESDGQGGTEVVARNYAQNSSEAAALCFAAGTSIATARSGVVVEMLRIGDLVVTASGALRPIRWLGHRAIDCRRHGRPHLVMPVRIAAHSFGPDRPCRDLFVSPGHAICVDVMGEVLIPAGALVDGVSVQQVDVDTVDYWHVELDAHDVVLAESLPAESYLDMGNRSFFRETKVVDLAGIPDAASRTHTDFCRPYHPAGPIVDVVRANLRHRAAGRGAYGTARFSDDEVAADSRGNQPAGSHPRSARLMQGRVTESRSV